MDFFVIRRNRKTVSSKVRSEIKKMLFFVIFDENWSIRVILGKFSGPM